MHQITSSPFVCREKSNHRSSKSSWNPRNTRVGSERYTARSRHTSHMTWDATTIHSPASVVNARTIIGFPEDRESTSLCISAAHYDILAFMRALQRYILYQGKASLLWVLRPFESIQLCWWRNLYAWIVRKSVPSKSKARTSISV